MEPTATFPVGLEHLDSSRPPSGFERSPNNEYWILQTPIEKSPNDKQNYQMIRLDNGLEAMLVSSESIDVAGAACSVKVGQLMDPVSCTDYLDPTMLFYTNSAD